MGAILLQTEDTGGGNKKREKHGTQLQIEGGGVGQGWRLFRDMENILTCRIMERYPLLRQIHGIAEKTGEPWKIGSKVTITSMHDTRGLYLDQDQ